MKKVWNSPVKPIFVADENHEEYVNVSICFNIICGQKAVKHF